MQVRFVVRSAIARGNVVHEDIGMAMNRYGLSRQPGRWRERPPGQVGRYPELDRSVSRSQDSDGGDGDVLVSGHQSHIAWVAGQDGDLAVGR